MLLNGHLSRARIVPSALAAATGPWLLYPPDGERKIASRFDCGGLPGGRTVAISTVVLDEVALAAHKVDLIKIDAERGQQEIVAGMGLLTAQDTPLIVLEYNAARYAEPRGFLDWMLAGYGTAQELKLAGEFVPLDVDAVMHGANRYDRLLLFR